MNELTGKTILVVEGSLLAGGEVKDAIERSGGSVCLTTNLISAFNLLNRLRFDGAVIDQALHNEAFELCAELRLRTTPYICCNSPHRLQGTSARRQSAEVAVGKLSRLMSERFEPEADAGVFQFLKTRSRGGGGLTGPQQGHAA